MVEKFKDIDVDIDIDRRKFRSQTSDNSIWTDGKTEVREEKKRSQKIREEKEREEKEASARKGRKVAIHNVFPMVCGPIGSKSRLAKTCTPLWREAHFQVKMCKAPNVLTTFGS